MASSRRRCTSAAELIELRIREFAIVDELTLRLEPGLNVLTGETGAGKSILIDALGAVLGDRASPTMVRAGTDRALIEATFSRTERLPEDIEISPEDDVLILSREIGASGRGAARINGRTVPVSMLQAAGRALVDVHGQSDHQSLLRPASHLYFLDRFGGLDEARESVAALVRELRQVRHELARLQGDAREMVRRQDLLRFQVDEIDGAALGPGEDEELAARRAVLANAERLRELVACAVAALGEERGAIDAALAAAKSVSRALSRYADAVEADPDELQRVDDRLDLLRSLKRKYGETLDEVLAYAESARGELAQLLGADARIEELQAREQELLAQVRAAAVALSQSRQEAATRLNGEVEAQLADLNMAGARFYAEVNARPGDEDPQPTGGDDVQFLLSANRGEPLRPLAQVASGGEASRLMLALKSVFSAVDETPVLVFDEIEVGVGARSGHVIGQKLRALAEHHQVLCITHLAPVAALAEAHFRVRKLEAGGRTGTAVDRLDQSERVDELAEMLAGKPIGEAARASARELLGAASATA